MVSKCAVALVHHRSDATPTVDVRVGDASFLLGEFVARSTIGDLFIFSLGTHAVGSENATGRHAVGSER